MGPFMLSCLGLYLFLFLIVLYPVPAIDRFLEIVCVPHEWRSTVVIIVMVNAAVSVLLETLVLDIILWRLVFSRDKQQGSHDMASAAHTPQSANDRLGSAFLSWLFCQRWRRNTPRARYVHLAQELQEDPNWPPRPTTITYASLTPHHHHHAAVM